MIQSILVSVAMLVCIPTASTLMGKTSTCDGEGNNVSVPGITDLPCISCSCRAGQVECQQEVCQDLDGCHAVMFDKPENRCCENCKGCRYNGTAYSSGTTWTDPTNPCLVFQCQVGVITQWEKKCQVQCDQPMHQPGQCCPSCSDCVYQGVQRKEGETFQPSNGSDITCQCERGRVRCWHTACPVLNCVRKVQYIPKGERCPKCKGQRKIFNVPSACFFARRIYPQKAMHMVDDCTVCTCRDETMHCQREVCPPVPCDVDDHVYVKGTCCPRCPDHWDCSHRNRTYSAGRHWLDRDSCQQCNCERGVVHCTRQSCPQPPVCPQSHSLKLPAGACCLRCIQDDAVCSMTVNAYHVTFDQRSFRASGSCRYHVARDCRRRSFFVKVRNSPHSGDEFWTEVVTVGIGKTVIRLFKSLKARVDKRSVALPFVSPAHFSLQRIGRKIIVNAFEKVGVKVIWDGSSHLEIKVSKSHGGNLCGLCGNNNGDPDDDFRNKRGVSLGNAEKFMQAWQVGGVCQNNKRLRTSKLTCSPGSAKAIDAEKHCAGLFHPEFSSCSSRIDIQPYISACLDESCSCPPKKSCHRRSIRSLARRCKRAGFRVRRWRVLR